LRFQQLIEFLMLTYVNVCFGERRSLKLHQDKLKAGANSEEEVAMKFHVYQCKLDADTFVVTDAKHAKTLTNDVCPSPQDELVKVGEFSEMGKKRVAFDEGLAKRSITHQGFYRFHSNTFDPVAEMPGTMP